jgi:DUF971 family protein
MDSLKPVGITADRNKRVVNINWSDGHTSQYTFTLLRVACPCAECRGGHANMGSDPSPEMFAAEDEESPATRLVNIEAVGTYGITPEWEDGHHYGIYNWGYLRKLCPCSVCRQEDGR